VHFASMLSASAQANPRLSTQINVMGAANAFEAAARLEMEKVVWMSSSGVFGAGSVPDSGVVNDHSVPDPEWTYGAAKLMGEKLAVAYADKYGINITGVRPTRVYGFGEHVKLARGGASSWLGNLLYKPAIGNEHCVVPFGRRKLNFLYVEDVSDGVLKALQYREPEGADSYLFSGDHRLISDAHAFVTRVLPEANCELSMDDLELVNGAAWAFTMDADSSRATERFGFRAKHSMEEGVLETLNRNRATVGLPPLPAPSSERTAADSTAGSHA
ncbi:MAG: SDR family oxidoreductase, partial [Comamonadaceae bacterium]